MQREVPLSGDGYHWPTVSPLLSRFWRTALSSPPITTSWIGLRKPRSVRSGSSAKRRQVGSPHPAAYFFGNSFPKNSLSSFNPFSSGLSFKVSSKSF